MTIFVSVASYRDTELEKTVKDLVSKADNPDDLYICVFDQNDPRKPPDLTGIPHILYQCIHYIKAQGAGYARKQAMSFYRGEDYFFQIDSHMRFAQGWDTELIDMYQWCVKDAGTDRIILSQFPSPYEALTDGSEHYPKDDPDFWDRPSWTSVVNTYYGAWAGNREEIEDFSVPHKSHTLLAGYLFTTGKFVEELPYDERISFMGEELCLAIRAYTRGYKIYAPHKMLIWHFYQRKDRPKVWNLSDNSGRKKKWSKIEEESRQVQKDVLLGIEQGEYGIGSVEKYKEYQEMIGIDFRRFYNEEIDERVNGSLTITEIDFSDEVMSGYCLSNKHTECKTTVCTCACHGKEVK